MGFESGKMGDFEGCTRTKKKANQVWYCLDTVWNRRLMWNIRIRFWVASEYTRFPNGLLRYFGKFMTDLLFTIFNVYTFQRRRWFFFGSVSIILQCRERETFKVSQCDASYFTSRRPNTPTGAINRVSEWKETKREKKRTLNLTSYWNAIVQSSLYSCYCLLQMMCLVRNREGCLRYFFFACIFVV